jgi:hypothetical protein
MPPIYWYVGNNTRSLSPFHHTLLPTNLQCHCTCGFFNTMHNSIIDLAMGWLISQLLYRAERRRSWAISRTAVTHMASVCQRSRGMLSARDVSRYTSRHLLQVHLHAMAQNFSYFHGVAVNFIKLFIFY